MKRFREGRVFKACRLMHHSVLGCDVVGNTDPTWKREFKLPWREAGPPNYHDAKMASDQEVVNKELYP